MNVFHRLKNKRILLVDDDEWIRDSLGYLFEAEGCQMMTLETAEEGLKVLTQNHYDIIIGDFELPGINGLEFFKRVQKLQPDSIKILITAFMNESLVAEGKKIGIQDFIAKPFNAEVLENSLEQLTIAQ